MDLKQIIILALQVSIFATVFAFGLKATSEDLLYLVRRPGLLARSLLAVLLIMPAVAVALVELFDFRTEVEIVLVALAISPVPPILPKKEIRAGGHASYGLGLLAMMALVSIVAIPLVLVILQWAFGQRLAIGPWPIAKVVLTTTLVPLLAGVGLRAVSRHVAEHLEKPVMLVGRVLLPVAVVVLVAGALPAIWAAVGDGTVLAMVVFTIAGLAIGHVLGGPDPQNSVVLALSTACRHPAIALTIAMANYPEYQFGAIILLYLLVSAIAGFPYLKWQQRPAAAPDVSHAHSGGASTRL